jgi:hypothetical protein
MRKLARLLPLAALLLLPGCIFAVTDDGWDDERPSYDQRLSQLDRRVRDLEMSMTGCQAECCKDKAPAKDSKASAAPAAHVQEIHASGGSR